MPLKPCKDAALVSVHRSQDFVVASEVSIYYGCLVFSSCPLQVFCADLLPLWWLPHIFSEHFNASGRQLTAWVFRSCAGLRKLSHRSVKNSSVLVWSWTTGAVQLAPEIRLCLRQCNSDSNCLAQLSLHASHTESQRSAGFSCSLRQRGHVRKH